VIPTCRLFYASARVTDLDPGRDNVISGLTFGRTADRAYVRITAVTLPTVREVLRHPETAT